MRYWLSSRTVFSVSGCGDTLFCLLAESVLLSFALAMVSISASVRSCAATVSVSSNAMIPVITRLFMFCFLLSFCLLIRRVLHRMVERLLLLQSRVRQVLFLSILITRLYGIAHGSVDAQ